MEGQVFVLPLADFPSTEAGVQGTYLFEGNALWAYLHHATGNEDGGDIDPGRGQENARGALVRTGNEAHTIEVASANVHLNSEGDDLSTGQGEAHARRSLVDAIANIRAVVPRRGTCRSPHPPDDPLLREGREVVAAGHTLSTGGLDENPWLFQVVSRPTARKTKRVRFGSDLPHFLAVQGHDFEPQPFTQGTSYLLLADAPESSPNPQRFLLGLF